MKRLSRFMDQIACEVYPEPRSGGHDQITAMVAPLVAAHLLEGCKVLDVGCGQGPAMEWFKQNGFRPVGISLCQPEIQQLRSRGFEVKYCDQNNLCFGDRSFECVWARHVIEHSIAPFWTLHEFNRVLEPKGILYVEVPAPDTDCHHESNHNHYSVMGTRMWQSLIVRAGFAIIENREVKLHPQAGPDTYFSYICRKTES